MGSSSQAHQRFINGLRRCQPRLLAEWLLVQRIEERIGRPRFTEVARCNSYLNQEFVLIQFHSLPAVIPLMGQIADLEDPYILSLPLFYN